MADFDHGWDRLDRLRTAAIEEVKEMLRQKVNSLQSPNWLQAAEMLVQLEGFLTPVADEKEIVTLLERIVSRWDQALAEHWDSQWEETTECLGRLWKVHLSEKEREKMERNIAKAKAKHKEATCHR